MDSSELKYAVQRRGANLCLETLAYLARHAHGQGQEGVDLLEAVSRHLVVLARPIARSVRHGSIRTDADWEDGTQFAFFAMLRDFETRPGEKLTFWEVNFRHIFKRRYVDGIVSLRRRVDRTSASVEQLAEEGTHFAWHPASPLDALTRRELLSILSPEEAIVAQLRWFDRLPMSGERSVPELMGVSRKTAYKYLRRAKAKVQADPRFDVWMGRA